MLHDNDKIRTLMEERGLSGNELAKRAGISGPSMHAILNGETKQIKYETLASIAAALGVPIQAISKAKHRKGDLQVEAMSAFAALSKENQAAMLATMIHLASQQKKP